MIVYHAFKITKYLQKKKIMRNNYKKWNLTLGAL